MAENKKSFILYADLLQTIERLPDEVAGKLIKIILQYVNDKNPVVDDLLLQIAFEPIKQQLKRDLKDWEETRGERSNSGKLGNLKRWNKELYTKVVNNKISLEEAEEIAKNRTAKKSIAKIAVTDTITVTDNVNEEKKEEFLNKIILPFTSEIFQASWQQWKDYRKIELSKTYKSIQSEQSALSHLENISQKNEYAALKIINQSIANQWQGLFELKKQQNGSSSKQESQRNAVETAIRIGQDEFAALRKKHSSN